MQIQDYVTRQITDAPRSVRDQKTLCWDQCGEIFLLRVVNGEVKEGTQMHSEVKKFNWDKAEIVVRQAEVEIQVIRYITVQNQRARES